MNTNREEPSSCGGGGGQFHKLQVSRNLESNWEVDLAQKLEEYLLKICSGEIHPSEDDGHSPVNFAEAALLLQGSVQVYSRKVEYLYSLVLRALEFLSQKRQQDQLEGTSDRDAESSYCAATDDEYNQFWVSNDIPVEAKISLDGTLGKESLLHCFVKPPGNLVVLEGDCLDATGDGGELESYLLATNDLYREFILLDPRDAIAVQDFLKADGNGKSQNGTQRVSLSRKSFQSPTRCSGGTANKSSSGKNQDANINRSSRDESNPDANNCDIGHDPSLCDDFHDNNNEVDMDDRDSEPQDLHDSDDESDPWKPMNPHETGNLKIKPFRKVKAFKRRDSNFTTRVSITSQFPPAKLNGPISPDLTDIWEKQSRTSESERDSKPPVSYEKLRSSLTAGGSEHCNAFFNLEDDNDEDGDDGGAPEFEQPDIDADGNAMDEDVKFDNEKYGDGAAHFDTNEAFGDEFVNSHDTLEDLCRCHLNALLESIAETEKQTELADRVSKWKSTIEHNLEDQESCPPFDIHQYGERILDKLTGEADKGCVMSFAEVVKGQEKYDVARSFSALLQLVNNGTVELDKGAIDGDLCYTATNPFHVRRLCHERKQEREIEARMSRKRSNSRASKEYGRGNNERDSKDKSTEEKTTERELSSKPNSKFPVKLGKVRGVICSPKGKRRRKSRLVGPVDLSSAG